MPPTPKNPQAAREAGTDQCQTGSVSLQARAIFRGKESGGHCVWGAVKTRGCAGLTMGMGPILMPPTMAATCRGPGDSVPCSSPGLEPMLHTPGLL